MVDEARVQRLLRRLSDTVGFLAAESQESVEVQQTRRWLDSVKYNFVTAIEACVDVGQHICADRSWGPPDTNADVFGLLAANDVLTADTARALARASGFRNVLVHEYIAVDDEIVRANLTRLGDLRDFTAQVAQWLQAARPELS